MYSAELTTKEKRSEVEELMSPMSALLARGDVANLFFEW